MSQVSRKPLSKAIQKRIFDIFFKSLASISNTSDIEAFVLDLLSPVEQTMLAKRLAIAILLAKGYRYESIKKTLNVSQETIARVNLTLQYRGKGYKMVVGKALRDEKLQEFFESVEDAAIEFLPHSTIKRILQLDKTARKPKTGL